MGEGGVERGALLCAFGFNLWWEDGANDWWVPPPGSGFWVPENRGSL